MTMLFKVFLGLFCLVIAFAVWLLAYGAIMWGVYDDPNILMLTLAERPLIAAEQFYAFHTNTALQGVAGMAALPALFVAGIVGAVGLRRPKNPLGDASFQTVPDLRMGKWFGKKGHVFGVVAGKYLRRDDDRHHLVIGPTRSGKGAGYVIPNALQHQGSMIVTDLKGEIYSATAAYRRKQGNQVFLFSPGAAETHRYNPLDFVRQDRGTRTTDIQNIASILIPEQSDSHNAIWQGLAQQVIGGIISYLLESPLYEGRRNFGEVNSLLNCGVNLQELLRTIIAAEPYLSRFTIESFNAYLALSDRAAASALIDIQKAMKPFMNERIVAATSVTDINLAGLQQRPVSIYLAPSITDITLLKPLLTLFIQQTMGLLTRELRPNPIPMLFLLDEFRQLRRVDEVMNKLPYVAGYKIKMAFIIQDLKNLDEIYGETARHSLLGNCGYQLILGANDQATADYVSKALGKQTIRYQTESRQIEVMGLNRRTRIEQMRDRDLMMPQEVRQLPESDLVLLVEGQKPVRAKKVRFFAMEPFQTAAAYGEAHRPEVPHVEIRERLPVPALAEGYGKSQIKAELIAAPPSTAPAEQPAQSAPAEAPVVAVLPAVKPAAETNVADTVATETPPTTVKRPARAKKPAAKVVPSRQVKVRPAKKIRDVTDEGLESKLATVEAVKAKVKATGDVAVAKIGKPRRRPVEDLFRLSLEETSATEAASVPA